MKIKLPKKFDVKGNITVPTHRQYSEKVNEVIDYLKHLKERMDKLEKK